MASPFVGIPRTDEAPTIWIALDAITCVRAYSGDEGEHWSAVQYDHDETIYSPLSPLVLLENFRAALQAFETMPSVMAWKCEPLASANPGDSTPANRPPGDS